MSSEPVVGIVAVLIERVPASAHPREAVPDVVYDVPADHSVTVDLRAPGRLTLRVSRPHGRPETQDSLVVDLTGAERAAEGPEALVYTGFEFARGDARQVVVTLVRG